MPELAGLVPLPSEMFAPSQVRDHGVWNAYLEVILGGAQISKEARMHTRKRLFPVFFQHF